MRNNKGEYFIDNTKMTAISPDTLDIYSRVEESGDNVVVTVAINKNREYINNASGNYVAIDDMLLRFEKNIKKETADLEIQVAQKSLKTLEKSLNEIKDQNKKLGSSIQDMKSEIADNERTIKSNDKTIEEMNSKIQEQDTMVKSLKSKADEYK
jgi:peptidoglycan hydrolase CwlO-like protein